MRILHVLDSFFPARRAGTETYVYNLVKELDFLGVESQILIPAAGKECESYFYRGIRVHCFSVPEKPCAEELNGLIMPRGYEHFFNYIRKVSPDVVHFHSFTRTYNSLNLECLSKQGIKTVFTAHLGGLFCCRGDLEYRGMRQCDGKVKRHKCLTCLMSSRGLPRGVDAAAAFLINLATAFSPPRFVPAAWFQVKHRSNELQALAESAHAVVAIAPWIKRAFELNGVNNTHLVAQGIDKDFIDSTLETREQSGPIKLCFIGRMHPDKGVHLLAEAIKGIPSDKLTVHIITLSDAQGTEYYETMKRAMVGLPNVSWSEDLSRNKIKDRLQEADCICLPSRHEVAPLVILEAYACKAFAIGSDYVAIRDQISHEETGLLFRNGDAADLQNQIERLLNTSELVQRLKDNIPDARGFDKVAEEMRGIYQSL